MNPNYRASRSMVMRHRDDLEVYPRHEGGTTAWVIKDPISLRYFQFSDSEFSIFRWLDGKRTLNEIVSAFNKRFAPRRLSHHELRGFVDGLHQSGLVHFKSSDQGNRLWERGNRQRFEQRLAAFANPLAIRLPGINPLHLVDWLYRRCRWCFSWYAGLAAAMLVTVAAATFATRSDEFIARLPTIDAFLSPANLIALAIALAIVKVLHELGHALTCRHFGGDCHEIGVMLLVFTPCLYCDVTDAWKLSNRWHRIAISAAGMIVEVVLASICGLLWWATDSGVVNSLLLNVVVVCSVGTVLVNANPLLRYDGYLHPVGHHPFTQPFGNDRGSNCSGCCSLVSV